ncbi:MAG: hypothetical protein K0S33_3998 [Bacteroidetes bacterium]|jgi:hypothetical protein|nr:hypothetical protein [Bacteroidota bacterium]
MRKTKAEIDGLLTSKFYEVFPKDQLPEWFDKYAVFLHSPDSHRKVVWLSVCFNKVRKLRENEAWEEYKGHMCITGVDPQTGEKMFTITDSYEPFRVFTACISGSMEITVHHALSLAELADLKEKDFVERNRF